MSELPPDWFVVKTLNTGTVIQATDRVLINVDLWFHFSDGWISDNYVQSWVKDHNDNNRWWHVEKGYKYPVVAWKTIAGKDYCFGMDEGYPSNTYYQYDTTTHDRKYRVIENFAAENAYQG